jgi:hypothetical protein
MEEKWKKTKWEREKMSGSNLKGVVAQFAKICEKGHLGICVGICEHLCVFGCLNQLQELDSWFGKKAIKLLTFSFA